MSFLLIALYIYIYTYIEREREKGASRVIVTVFGNGHRDPSSNPGQDCISHSANQIIPRSCYTKDFKNGTWYLLA